MKFLKKLFSRIALTPPLTGLENALITSLKTDPLFWSLSIVEAKLAAHNREKGVIIQCSFLGGRPPEAFCRKYTFSPGFSQLWFSLAHTMYLERLRAETAAEALNVENQLKQAFKI